MKKPKLIIVGTSWPFRGGLSAYNERLATEFQKKGYDVVIYTFTLQYPGILFPGKTQMADWDAPVHLEIRQTINSVNPITWIRTANSIRREYPDLVIIKYWLPFMGPCFGTIGRLIRRKRKTKIISILDNIIPHEKRPGDRMFTKYFIKPVNAFLAMSDSVLEDINKFDTVKPRSFCPHPLFDNFGEIIGKKEAKQYLGLDSSVNYALFFGFVREYKGLDLALKAFGYDQLRKHNVKLLIAGEFYDNLEKYNAIIKELSISDRIEMRTDFIADSEVKYYFCASDIIVQPYKTATQSGISQIAYHFNKPMIVTGVGGLPEIVPDGKVGFVVDRSSKAISDAIHKFYEHKLEETFSQGAREEKQKYSWNRMFNTIEELTRKI
ncbi:MAG: glycosyltransferase [Bacteroidales bacterium]|nr:glycosyltransferase [Bacteroidales bacterium]